VSFEEASVAKAEKRAAQRDALLREGNVRLGGGVRKAQPPPFALAAAGRPEVAFLWKNLLASASYLQRPRVALIVALGIALGSAVLARLGIPPLQLVVGMLSMLGAAATLMFGPMLARQDLRHDLPNADVLKTYPLPGWQVVLGEVLAPIALVTTLIWLQVLAAALNLISPPGADVTLLARAAVALGIALIAPFLAAVLVVLMNAAVLLFPAWVAQGAQRARGIDVMGQRMIFVAALFLTMVVALLPAVIAAAALFFLTFWLIGPFAAGALGLLGALVCLAVEIALAIAWLGRVFERFDLSAELKP
jgi:hypothetical protein